MSSWEVIAGTKKGGPFTRRQLEQLAEANRLSVDAFIRLVESEDDWKQVATVDWLIPQPEPAESRYCLECDARVIVSQVPREKASRCPNCSAAGQLVNFAQTDPPPLGVVLTEPWGRFDVIVYAASCMVIAAGILAAIALVFQPLLAVLFAFILLASGGCLFAITFEHRSRCEKYFRHLSRLEGLLHRRTEALQTQQTELVVLKRNLARVRDDLIHQTNRELDAEREKIGALHVEAAQNAGAVDRMAAEYLKNTSEWWIQKLNGQNFELTKTHILKAVAFCRKQGYQVLPTQEKQLTDPNLVMGLGLAETRYLLCDGFCQLASLVFTKPTGA